MSVEKMKAVLLGSKNYRVKRVTVRVFDTDTGKLEEKEVGVRQMTMLERAKISNDSARATSAEDKAKVNARVVLYSACDPDTGERLFEPANLDSLTAQPGGGWLDEVALAALEIMSLPVVDSFCPEPLMAPDGKPVLDEAGKPAKCGGKLVLHEKFCPRCGHEAPALFDQVKGS